MAYVGPNGTVWTSCNEGWTSVPAPTFVSATKTVTSTSEYNGIGGQLSRTIQETRGPALEVSPQYFADSYSFCTRLYGYGCNTSGSCKMEGLEPILQGSSTTEYTYSDSGELESTKVTNRNTRLSAAKPFDWRSDIQNGFPTDFKTEYGSDEFLSRMYIASVVTTTYSKEKGKNVEEVVTIESPATRGTGISDGPIDASSSNGIKTSVRRVSTTTSSLGERPDSVVSLTADTIALETTIRISPKSNYTGPGVAGPYEIEKQIPVPLLLETEEEVSQAVNAYSSYISKFIKGDLYGLQIGESLRSDICDQWEPGLSFRYSDPANNKISAMRMDACSWGVTQEESIVVTNGIWTGFSRGTLQVNSNLTGNSMPSLEDSAPTPPSPPSTPPAIIDDQVPQSLFVDVSGSMNLSGYVHAPGGGSISPLPSGDDILFNIEMASAIFCEGSVVGPGDLLSATGGGDIPAEANGQLITEGATIIIQDVFAAP